MTNMAKSDLKNVKMRVKLSKNNEIGVTWIENQGVN